ncbi:MAG: hypothetical protein DCC49_06225 [Acidobacteria bacterium]|nr:MAG: hypothetical protein DCC49_06225 [Acidobacteriota bacterium]
MQLSEQIRAIRRWALIVLIVLVAVAFDTDTFDVFNLTKFTIVLLGTIVITSLWVVECVQRKKFLRPKTGIEPALLGLLVATAAATAFSFSKVVSLVGFYKSYDGLVSVLAFTLLGLCAAEVFDNRQQIRQALVGATFVGGGFAAFYGVLQYITFATEGRYKLDWESWGAASFKTSAVFSTYGNPNHLAGYLAMMIPLAIVLGVISKKTGVKVLSWSFVVVAFLEILQVQTRGAWVAVAFISVGLSVLFLPEIKKNPIPFVAVAVAVLLLFGFAGLTLRGRGDIFKRITSIADTQESSGRQRVLLWEAGLQAAKERPIFGWGPDTFRVVFLRYQGYEFAARYGPTQVANGPHNIFVSWLYSAGLFGFAMFLWLLAAFFRRSISAISASLAIERDPPKRDRAVITSRSRDDRLILGAVALAIVAYLVGESFNVNQIGLSFSFWVMTGLGGAYSLLVRDSFSEYEAERERIEKKKAAKEARAANKNEPDSAAAKNPKADRVSAKAQGSKGKAKSKSGGSKGRGGRSQSTEKMPARTWLAAGICFAISLPLAYLAVIPYRGDRVYRKAVPAIEEAKGYAQELQKTPNAGDEAMAFVASKAEAALALAQQSYKTNPTESRYLFDVFEMAQLKSFLLKSGPLQLDNVKIAEGALIDALRLSPEDERYYRSLGDLYAYWGGGTGPQKRSVTPPDPSKLRDAVERLHGARQYNPYDYETESLLMRVGEALGDTAIQSDAGQHGFYLGDAALTVKFADLLVANGDAPGAIAVLETFINRHLNQPDVDRRYGELAGKPPPVVTESNLPIPKGPAPVEPGVPVPGLPPGLRLPGWN